MYVHIGPSRLVKQAYRILSEKGGKPLSASKSSLLKALKVANSVSGTRTTHIAIPLAAQPVVLDAAHNIQDVVRRNSESTPVPWRNPQHLDLQLLHIALGPL